MKTKLVVIALVVFLLTIELIGVTSVYISLDNQRRLNDFMQEQTVFNRQQIEFNDVTIASIRNLWKK